MQVAFDLSHVHPLTFMFHVSSSLVVHKNHKPLQASVGCVLQLDYHTRYLVLKYPESKPFCTSP